MKIDNNYRLVYEENGTVTLQFYEERIRVKKDTGLKESFEFTENYYYANIIQALTAYSKKALVPSDTIKEVLDSQKCIELNLAIFYGKR